MKVGDITREQQVQEAPVGAMKRAGQAVAGKFSKKQARKGEISKEANQVAKELKTKLGAADIDLNDIPVDTFVNFMKQKGYDNQIEQEVGKFVDSNDSEATLNRKQAEQVLLSQVRAASLSPQGSGVRKGKFAGGSSGAAAKKKSGFAAGYKQATGKSDKQKTSQKQKKPKQSGSMRASDRQFQQIQQQLDSLTDRQRQQLIKTLQQ